MFVDHSSRLIVTQILWTFQKFFDLTLMQHIVEETNKHAQQQIAKTATPNTFGWGIRKWKGMTMDKKHVVLALFTATGILQISIQRVY
jgi:hypothetical protein